MLHRDVSIGDGERGFQRENKNTVAKHLIKASVIEVVKLTSSQLVPCCQVMMT